MVFRRAIEEVEKAYYQDQAKLIDRIAELENVQAGLLERGIQLEQLCRDMYERIQLRDKEVSATFGWSKQACLFSDRMDALGLLEGGDK